MKALMLSDYNELRLIELGKPSVGADDVLVRVQACGICGSDVHGYDGSTGRRRPPIVMGHEAAGVVEEVGGNVARFAPGDRVTFDSTIFCGDCHFCRSGRTNLCEDRMVLGVSCDDYRCNGAFAEYVSVPERICYSLPEAVSFEHAAMIEAVSVAVHAVNRTPVSIGDTAVVVGSGMIGLLVIQALRLAGCSQVIAVDIDAKRLEKAMALGAHAAIKADEANVAEEVIKRTRGQGANVAMEVVGTQPAIESAIDSVCNGGSVTLVGNLSPRVQMPLQSIVTRELNVLGTCASNGEYPACIDLLASGSIQVDDLITARAPLEDGPSWFDRLHRGESDLMKVVLEPGRSQCEH